MELLSLVLAGKDVSRLGQELLSRGLHLGESAHFGPGWGGWEQEGCLASVLSGLADEWGQLLAGSWCLPGPSIAVPGLHLQSRKCLSPRGSLKRVPLRSRAKVLQPHDLSARG